MACVTDINNSVTSYIACVTCSYPRINSNYLPKQRSETVLGNEYIFNEVGTEFWDITY
jgi:hypothetical protein